MIFDPSRLSDEQLGELVRNLTTQQASKSEVFFAVLCTGLRYQLEGELAGRRERAAEAAKREAAKKPAA